MYNGAGKWIVDVGIPAKSGVAGLVMAVVPGVCGFAVFSPKLDEHGNSTRGVLVAAAISESLGLHVLKQNVNAQPAVEHIARPRTQSGLTSSFSKGARPRTDSGQVPRRGSGQSSVPASPQKASPQKASPQKTAQGGFRAQAVQPLTVEVAPAAR